MDCLCSYGLIKIYLVHTAVPILFCHPQSLGSTLSTSVTSTTQSTSPWNCITYKSQWILKYSSRLYNVLLLSHYSSGKLKWKAVEFISNALKYLVHQNVPKKDYIIHKHIFLYILDLHLYCKGKLFKAQKSLHTL